MISSGGTEELPPLEQIGAWYRADSIGLADGSSVPLWPDRSGNGNDAATISGVPNPTFNASDATLGNRQSVSFNGAQAIWKTNPTGFAIGSAAVTTYVVMDPDYSTSTPNYQVAYSYGKNAGTPGPSGSVFLSLTQTQYGNRTGIDVLLGGWRSTTNASGPPIIQSFSLAAGATVNLADYRINGESSDQVEFTPFGSMNIQSPVEYSSIGCQSGYTGGDFFFGRIAEILYYAKQHTTSERNATLGYLSRRYSIALSG
jgi:hypothetical protein